MPIKAVGLDVWRLSVFLDAAGEPERIELIAPGLVVEASRLSSIEWTSPTAGSTGRIKSKVLASALAAIKRRRSPKPVALGRDPVVEFEQQAGGEATGDAPCHEQIADPCE